MSTPSTFRAIQRIAERFGPEVAAAFLRAVFRLQEGIDPVDLLQAVASGSVAQIEAAVGAGRLAALFAGEGSMQQALTRAGIASGATSADIVSGATGVRVNFSAVDANTVLFARRATADLVVAVSEDVREAIRIAVTLGAADGLTTVQQARAIREVVGLPPNWVAAPFNLGRELRDGTFTDTRRMSAVDKARIRKALREGTADEAFIQQMQARYAASLTNRRALNIARTETLRSSLNGMRQGWRQAVKDGALPETARRHWIVTPDDRLRDEHAAIPGLNPNGVGLDEPFQTPEGTSMGPPLDVNCRCGEALMFPGRRGML